MTDSASTPRPWLRQEIPVLPPHGYILPLDYMGNDQEIVNAARASYGRSYNEEQAREASPRRLLRYLMRHWHCYRGDMQVLTADGWKCWEDCNQTERFAVPDPETRTFRWESLPLEQFDAEDDLCLFESERMSYAVTHDHRMWFKPKYQEGYAIHRAGEMSKWGHFDPTRGYTNIDREGPTDPLAEFTGFWLGDGSHASRNTVTFHLLKDRKKTYLRELCERNGFKWTEKPSTSCEGATVFLVHENQRLGKYTDRTARTKTKAIRWAGLEVAAGPFGPARVRGLLKGLIESDGHRRPDRPQIQFASASPQLRRDFELLCAMVGYDAHHTKHDMVIAYTGEGRTSLESRGQYHSREYFRGKVYCATTSTGLLMVRGGPDKFGFVCGNTSPFEMVEIKLEVQAPLFVARQWHRHRTASINEISGRYTELPDAVYSPPRERFVSNDKSNKQGSGEPLEEADATNVSNILSNGVEAGTRAYHNAVSKGLTHEMARIAAPLATYTRWVWKIDGHNLLHFLRLRMDHHAQHEIRVYAHAIADVVKQWLPHTWEAFEDYRLHALTFSRMETKALRALLQMHTFTEQDVFRVAEEHGLYPGERREFVAKVNRVYEGLLPF